MLADGTAKVFAGKGMPLSSFSKIEVLINYDSYLISS